MSGQQTQISMLAFPEFADTTERRFIQGGSLVKDLDAVKSLYMYEDVPNGVGDRKVYDEIDGETYARRKPEGQNAVKVGVIKGYSKTLYNYRFGCEIDITAEARMYGKNQEIIKKLTSLATFCPQRMALDMTHRLTFASATSYTDMDGNTVDVTMGDGLALASSVHTLTGSSSTYSSIITGNPVFSQGALEVAKMQANTQILSNLGERRVLEFNTVVISDDPATEREARQLLTSTTDITQNNAGVVNVYKGMFKLVILPRLATTASGAYDSTKAKQWHFIAVGEWEAHIGCWEQPNLKKPATGNNGEDIHNDDWTFGARCGFGLAIVTAKGCLTSLGTGA